MKISQRLILSFLVTVVLVGLVGYTCFHQFRKISEPLHNEVPQSIKGLSEASRLDSMAQFIRYYDEVLTQSARNYAFTQDPKWQQRYNEIAPKLDEIIAQAIEHGSDEDKAFFSSVNKANLALVEMESKSFELVDAGRGQKAIEILQGQEYWAHKSIYEQGLRDYISSKGAGFDDALKASTSQIESANAEAQEIIATSLLVIAVLIGSALVLSAVMGLYNYRSIITPIQKLKAATVKIGAGDLETELEVNSNDEIGELAGDFKAMLAGLKEAKYKNESQDWLKTGQTGLYGQIRGENEIAALCQNIITFTGRYLDAQVGAIYLVDQNTNRLELASGYALAKSEDASSSFAFGEGLVGQAAIKKESIRLVDIPDDYIKVSSSLGETSARNIMVLPILLRDEVVGVIELGSLNVFSDLQVEFLRQIIEPVAIAIRRTQSNFKMQELLAETQAQSEELQTQSEELLAMNEELEAQARNLDTSGPQLQDR